MNSQDLALIAPSRFQLNALIVFDGVETYGIWTAPWFIKDPTLLRDDQIGSMVIKSGSDCRPDHLSQQIYGTPYLDWVIIAFNRPRDVLNWPRAGVVVRYPLPEVVHRYLD